MSKLDTQLKIEVLRNETQEGANTRGRVATIFTDLNNSKVELDASNLIDESDIQAWKDKIGGGLSTVLTDSTLQGDGSELNPIGLSEYTQTEISNKLDKTTSTTQSVASDVVFSGNISADKIYLYDAFDDVYEEISTFRNKFKIDFLQFDWANLSEVRNFEFPNKNGQIALLSDVISNVETDTTLKGNGTTTSKLGIADAIKTQIDTNTSTIATHTSQIATNTSNIATNTSQISANTTAISNKVDKKTSTSQSIASPLVFGSTINANNLGTSTTYTKAVVENSNGDMKTTDVVEIYASDGTATKFASDTALNTAYPNAPIGFELICPNISTTNFPNGVVYKKTANGWRPQRFYNLSDV